MDEQREKWVRDYLLAPTRLEAAEVCRANGVKRWVVAGWAQELASEKGATNLKHLREILRAEAGAAAAQ